MSGFVALIGRANVGKSTLFNRITKTNRAIIDDMPGVTRDRLYGRVDGERWGVQPFHIIDTGGFETEKETLQPFHNREVWRQSCAAVSEADVVVMVLDGKSGLHPHDREIDRVLRNQNKTVVYVVNKIDGPEQESRALEFYELGMESYITVSAAHNRGLDEIVEDVDQLLKEKGCRSAEVDDPNVVRVAIVGRPNAGKSSILNRMVGEDRAIVSEVAGTTRDPMDVKLNYNGRSYEMIDTAGIRRRGKVTQKIEAVSAIRAFSSVDRADVVLLILDAEGGLTDQDARIANYAYARHKPMLVVVNKWDLVEEKNSNSTKEYIADLHYDAPTLDYAPVIFISCLHNQRVHKILPQIEKLMVQYERRVGTSQLNQTLETLVKRHTPALIRNHKKRVKFYYATQARACPPTIVIKCNFPDELQDSYKRYLNRKLQKELGFSSIPLHVVFRGKKQDNAVRQRN